MVVNSEKIRKFSRCALRHILGAFLRDINGRIVGMPRSRHNTEHDMIGTDGNYDNAGTGTMV